MEEQPQWLVFMKKDDTSVCTHLHWGLQHHAERDITEGQVLVHGTRCDQQITDKEKKETGGEIKHEGASSYAV